MYGDLQTQFQSLDGVSPNEASAPFDVLTKDGNPDEFKSIIEEFVNRCRQAAHQ